MISALITVQKGNRFVGKAYPCICVGVDIADCAPGQEGIRIEIDAVDNPALRRQAFLAGLSLLEPLAVGVGQDIGIRHDGANAGVTLAVVPAQASRPDS